MLVDVFTAQGGAIAQGAIARIEEIYAVEVKARQQAPGRGFPCAKQKPSPSSMPSNSGSTISSPNSMASHRLLGPSAMPLVI